MPKDVVAQPYPGSTAMAREVLDLAKSYQKTAHTLYAASTGRGAEAARPAHLCALQAIELATNAWRSHKGETHKAIRQRRHRLDCPVLAKALGLRDKTAAHLIDLTARQEYHVVRYEPVLPDGWSLRSRMTATLDEVISMVELRIAAPTTLVAHKASPTLAPTAPLTPAAPSGPADASQRRSQR